ncbi:SNF1-related protein kinase regulatory subunit gamma-1-like isoform X1 [Asparagus officinalis]|uniref:SNF1-related protein kinase regulatory subunit gamma-1-like isoform X1 n=1 Tax=Asparagus officinalis TaxID=4686 RepID=UPI00098E804A|nr:SNF1-related protein kinase regulatory subunit gamma-1-like isoform X1 [Asparagus officinalis]
MSRVRIIDPRFKLAYYENALILSEIAANGTTDSSIAEGIAAEGLEGKLSKIKVGTAASKVNGTTVAAETDNGVNAAVKHTKAPTELASSVDGSFLENLTSSDLYKNTKVRDISGSFRWAPFLALQSSDSFLTMMLLLSKYRMKSLPVVDLGEGKIENVITQSAVVHMLEECVGLHWFENWGTKKLFELGLPISNKLIKVSEEDSVLKAFQMIRKRRIGGLPVVDKSRKKAIGNISIRDVQYFLTAPEIFKDYRSITTKDFITTVKSYLKEQGEDGPNSHGVITCRSDDTIKDVILKLDAEKIQRIYVVDKEDRLEGVVTLRDIISRLVHEPNGYFGDFFDGVVPLPENSRV